MNEEYIAHLAAIVESSEDTMLSRKLDGEIISWNQGATKIFGYSADEIIGKNVSLLVPTELQNEEAEILKKIGNGEKVSHYVTKRIRSDGTVFDASITLSAIRNKEGIIIGASIVLRDVSERVKSTHELEMLKERYRALLENNNAIISLHDDSLNYIYQSPSSTSITGWSDSDMKLIDGINRVHPDDLIIIKNVVAEALKKPGIPQPYIYRYLHKNGHYIWLEGTATKLPDESIVKGIVFNSLDVTERKKTEKEIKESEETYRLLYESITDSVIMIQINDDLSYRYLKVNDFACKQYGYTRQEFLAANPPDIVSENPKNQTDEWIRGIFNIQNSLYQIEHKTKDGKSFPVEISANTITLYGKKIINCIIRDISERKKAELEIIKTADQLRQLTTHLQTVREEERKRIGREIHDELGQQLTAIKMDTVWINKHIPAETVAIKNKLQNIIDLLDGSHQSVRKILNELRPTMLDENGLLDAMEWQGQQFTESTGTPLHFTCNEKIVKLSQESATCIFRVYQESLTNIMRHAMATKVVSSLNIINDSIVLTIEDDGKGFDTKKTESEIRFGILGIKERVFALNGKFELHSIPGKGTRMVISLPY